MPNQVFFASAVQVIPVLFLVLAIEARLFQALALKPGWEERLHLEGFEEDPEFEAWARETWEQVLRRHDLKGRVAAALFVSFVTAAEIVGFLALLTERETLRWIAAVVVLIAIVLLLLRIAALALKGTIRPGEPARSGTGGGPPPPDGEIPGGD